ncbi:MAG: hypothetical protein GXZ09_01410 [Syntrophomonadaceae bacterium]|nr:hypothetical protein [Syntrophomonadaceae bacterium]
MYSGNISSRQFNRLQEISHVGPGNAAALARLINSRFAMNIPGVKILVA